MNGKIIVLNGTSSAGKTTLAKAIQAKARTPFQLVSFDQFRDGLPDRFRGLNSPPGSPGSAGLNVVAGSHDGSTKTFIEFGTHALAVLHGMHEAVASVAATGQNVVVDHFVNHDQVAKDLCNVLDRFELTLVAVHCGLDELRRRESARPGRFPGTAETQRDFVYNCLNYDIDVDSTQTAAFTLAETVLQHVSYHTVDSADS